MDDADDGEPLEEATRQERTVITSEADVLALDAQWQSRGKPHAGIIYVPPERKDAIGIIVVQRVFLHAVVAAGAANLAPDVYKRVLRLERRVP